MKTMSDDKLTHMQRMQRLLLCVQCHVSPVYMEEVALYSALERGCEDSRQLCRDLATGRIDPEDILEPPEKEMSRCFRVGRNGAIYCKKKITIPCSNSRFASEKMRAYSARRQKETRDSKGTTTATSGT